MEIKTWQERAGLPLHLNSEDCTDVSEDMQSEIDELRKYVAELEAARMAYASEFEYCLDAEGMPDVSRIHENIRKLKRVYVEAAVDAERYRWLRQQPCDITTTPRIDVVHWQCNGDDSVNEGEGLRMEQLDEAIDKELNK